MNQQNIQFDSKAYATRLANFVIAQIVSTIEQDELVAAAGDVLVLLNGKFVSVKDLVEKASNHGWNSMIYEAWCWGFRNQIFSYKSKLHPFEFEAMHTYACSYGDLGITHKEASEAISDALHEMEGTQEVEDYDE